MEQVTQDHELIDVDKLSIGMCLSRPVHNEFGLKLLDAGVYINSELQIEKLRQGGVRKVFVSRDQSQVETGTAIEKKQADTEFRREIEDPDKIIDSLKQELVVARKIYDSAKSAIDDVLHNVRMGKNIDSETVRSTASNLIESVVHNHQALISMVNLKRTDEYTFNHSVNVTAISLSIATHLSMSPEQLDMVGIGALMHDVGKAKIDINIINKPGKLTEEEFEIMQRHPVYGFEICKRENFREEQILDIVRHHHEAYNGSGYPDRLSRRSISKYAALVSIADCYDALTTERSYKKSLKPAESIHFLHKMSNNKFDRRLVFHFIKVMGIYPVGSVLKLNSGRIGIVVGFSRKNLLHPILKILVNDDGSFNRGHETLLLHESEDFITDLNPNFRFKGNLEDIL